MVAPNVALMGSTGRRRDCITRTVIVSAALTKHDAQQPRLEGAGPGGATLFRPAAPSSVKVWSVGAGAVGDERKVQTARGRQIGWHHRGIHSHHRLAE